MKKYIDKIKSSNMFLPIMTALVTGLICHMYMLTHNFMTYDGLWNQYSPQDMITSGRQFLTYFAHISSDYDLHYLNGILSIFFLSITAGILTEILGIKGKAERMVTAALVVSFPTLASLFTCMFTADAYMLALLISTLAIYLIKRYRFGWIAAIFMMGLGLGVYQAFFSFAVTLCMFSVLIMILDNEDIKKILMTILRMGLSVVGAYAFYVISLKVMMNIKGADGLGYQGTDKLTSFSPDWIMSGLKAAYSMFYSFPVRTSVFRNGITLELATLIMVIAGVGLTVYLFIKKGAYKKWYSYLLALLIICVLPLGINMVNIMSQDIYYNMMVKWSWILPFVYVITLSDRVRPEIDKDSKITFKEVFKKQWLSIIVVITTFVMVYNFIVISNIAYYNMNERYEKSYAFALRIVDRFEQMEDYKAGDKIALLGGIPREYPSTDITVKDVEYYTGSSGDLIYSSSTAFASFIYHYLNVTVTTLTFDEEMELVRTEEFENMPCFPDEASIQKINGVWVIKING